jgi:hypothetical protein
MALGFLGLNSDLGSSIDPVLTVVELEAVSGFEFVDRDFLGPFEASFVDELLERVLNGEVYLDPGPDKCVTDLDRVDVIFGELASGA